MRVEMGETLVRIELREDSTMNFFRTIIIILIGLLIGYVCQPLLVGAWAEGKLSTPMTFSVHRGCSNSSCPYYILAEGIITSDTPRGFLEFTKTIKGRPTIYFNSPGGNMAAGLELGRIIRELDLNTFVGGPYVSLEGFDEKYVDILKTLVKNGICFSACAYAFLGGTSREIGERGLLGFHQFYGMKGDMGESNAQLAMTVVANYLDEMGVDRQLLDIASVTPSKDVAAVTPTVAQQLNVDNTNPPKGEWEINVTNSGKLFANVVQKLAKKNATASFFLTRENNYFLGTIRYFIRQKFRSDQELISAFRSPYQQPIRLYREYYLQGKRYETQFPLKVLQPWKRQTGGSFIISFSLDIATLKMIAQGQDFDFEASFAKAYSDIDPSVTFSTNKLQGVLSALLKQ
jgi:hypothetical protein